MQERPRHAPGGTSAGPPPPSPAGSLASPPGAGRSRPQTLPGPATSSTTCGAARSRRWGSTLLADRSSHAQTRDMRLSGSASSSCHHHTALVVNACIWHDDKPCRRIDGRSLPRRAGGMLAGTPGSRQSAGWQLEAPRFCVHRRALAGRRGHQSLPLEHQPRGQQLGISWSSRPWTQAPLWLGTAQPPRASRTPLWRRCQQQRQLARQQHRMGWQLSL